LVILIISPWAIVIIELLFCIPLTNIAISHFFLLSG